MGDLEGAAELAAVGIAVGEPGITVGAAVGVNGWSPVWNRKDKKCVKIGHGGKIQKKNSDDDNVTASLLSPT